MDERYRILLDRNRMLLIKNLILTEEFYDQLQREKVLPLSMIADVKEEGLSRDERVVRLLNGLQLRTSAAFRRFRRVLLASGHVFLADVLWEEEPTPTNLEDTVCKRFPTIFDRVPDDIRKKLIVCLDTMVREKNLVTSWQTAPTDRLDVLRSRAADFKHERHLRSTVDHLMAQVRRLQTEVKDKDEQIQSLSIEVETLNKDMERIKAEHLSDIDKQANFNTANSKSIMRLKERFDMVNTSIVGVNLRLRSFLGEDAEQCEGDPDNVKITVLERNLKKVLDLAGDGRENASSTFNDKEAVCAILGIKKSKYMDKSLPDIIKSFLQKDEKTKSNLLKELQQLSVVLTRDNPMMSENTANMASGKVEMRQLTMQVAMVHAQLEHLQKKVIWKDSEIDTLKQEVSMLKKNLSNAKTRTKSRVSSPDMTREMKLAYANVHEYLKDEKPETSQGSMPVRSVARVSPGSKSAPHGGQNGATNMTKKAFGLTQVRDYDVKPAPV